MAARTGYRRVLLLAFTPMAAGNVGLIASHTTLPLFTLASAVSGFGTGLRRSRPPTGSLAGAGGHVGLVEYRSVPREDPRQAGLSLIVVFFLLCAFGGELAEEVVEPVDVGGGVLQQVGVDEDVEEVEGLPHRLAEEGGGRRAGDGMGPQAQAAEGLRRGALGRPGAAAQALVAHQEDPSDVEVVEGERAEPVARATQAVRGGRDRPSAVGQARSDDPQGEGQSGARRQDLFGGGAFFGEPLGTADRGEQLVLLRLREGREREVGGRVQSGEPVPAGHHDRAGTAADEEGRHLLGVTGVV
ncbi:hypothetical protein ABT403_29185, partial [Streptomyces sp. NPDC000075]